MHAGSGPGLTPRPLGQKSGAEAVTLSLLEMPQHNHIATTDAKMYAEGRPGNSVDPTGNMLAAQRAGGTNMYRANVAAEDVQMDSAMVQATTTIGSSGSSQPHFNMQPYTAVNFVICLQGIFPSRS